MVKCLFYQFAWTPGRAEGEAGVYRDWCCHRHCPEPEQGPDGPAALACRGETAQCTISSDLILDV